MNYSINAYAKINLGLDVIRRRPDGYHDLKMIMQTIGLHDELTFNVSEGDSVTMTCSNRELPCDDTNLVIRAARLLTTEFNIHKHIDIYLEKNIPVAAGMAGGSTDAAATLIVLNELFKLGLNREQLMRYGVTLGADIPYCIMGGTALAEGIGDILTPIAPPVAAHVLIVKPPIEVSTGFVYSNLKLTDNTIHPDIDGIIKVLPMSNEEIGERLDNILETVTIPAYPVIANIKSCMKANGALGALMSGSGPTVFGIFDDYNHAGQALEACMHISDNMFGMITEYHTA